MKFTWLGPGFLVVTWPSTRQWAVGSATGFADTIVVSAGTVAWRSFTSHAGLFAALLDAGAASAPASTASDAVSLTAHLKQPCVI